MASGSPPGSRAAPAARWTSTTAPCTKFCTAWSSASALYTWLQGRGYISAEWGVTENKRRARYYRLTASGRKHLRAETERWLRYATSVTAILTLTARPARS